VDFDYRIIYSASQTFRTAARSSTLASYFPGPKPFPGLAVIHHLSQ
jgi:hypothetical protein